MRPFPALVFALLLAACASAPQPLPSDRHVANEPSPQIVATAHPLATRAALAMLERGGSPIDAAIAAQMVLGLVEPQSSGIGGGSIALYWDASSRKLTSFDGLATAGARVTPALDVDVDSAPLDRQKSLRGGRAAGVPGTLAMLQLAHARFGRLPWRDLFVPAVALAENGFPLAPYLHEILERENIARGNGDMRRLYFSADAPFAAGTQLHNVEYARTLRAIADEGPQRWLENGGAARFVAAAQDGYRPSLLVERDLLEYRALEREPICGAFVAYTVCTMAPPSHGGLIVLEILQILEARTEGRFDFADPAFVHVFAEASKIGQADRRRHIGDPAFVAMPVAELASAGYARKRAAEIGDAAQERGATQPFLSSAEEMTSQLAIADRDGNVLSLTTTINLNFGAGLMADGYVLNNAMNLFAAAPRPGEHVPNRMEPRKRPTTGMAPVIAFDRSGEIVVAGGSAGGGPIPDYVAASLVVMLANGGTPAQALAHGHLSSFVRGKLELEQGSPIAALAPALRAKGHNVEEVRLLSGLAFIMRERGGWIGATDPRRDGTAEQK